MSKQTFEIIDGVYEGPSIWEGNLDLREYKDTLTSLGTLKKVRGWLWLTGFTSLTSLGSLKGVGGSLDLDLCTDLTSLGSLKEVGGYLDLCGCTSLTSLGSLTEVGSWLGLRGCTSLTSLGSRKEVGGSLHLSDNKSSPLREVQERVFYYSSILAHEALNALHTDEVQEVPLYKNILLQTLQGVSG